MVLNVHRNHKAYQGREGGGGKWREGTGGMEGEGDYIPIPTASTRMTLALRWAAIRTTLTFH